MGAGREGGRGRCWARVGLFMVWFVAAFGAEPTAYAEGSAIASNTGDTLARPVRVHYQSDDRPGACVSHQTVRAAVQRALRRSVFFDVDDSDVAVVLDLHAPFGATIELFDRDGHSLGTRRLEAKDCAELTQTVAFTMTLMVDFRADEVGQKRALAESAKAQAAADALASETAPANAGSAPAPAQATPVAPIAPTQKPKSPSKAAVPAVVAEGAAFVPGLGLALDTGLTPLPLLGLYGEAGLGTGDVWRFVVRVRGERSLDAERALGRLGAWRAALTAEACRLREGDEFGFGVCGGLTPGAMWVLVSGYAADRTTMFFGADAELTLRLSVPLGGETAASLQFGGGLPLLRNDWHARSAEGNAPLFRAAAVRVVGTLGLVWGG